MANLRAANGHKDAWKLKYFGVGNENWGCGGRMNPEYYADLYKRYSLYCRNYGENKLYKIACGARNDDYYWTDVLMREAGGLDYRGSIMDGLALHYYTSVKRLPDGTRLGHATRFSEDEWAEIVYKGLMMDELVRRHGTVMDKYDPQKKVAMVVDEWGTWYAAEDGTNPRFLYQQNTMRDAVVAATTLDIFNKHCDRVRMANIAQTVNVLQAMILTDKGKMILTPSYHVFEMYTVHQDATMVPLEIKTETYEKAGYSVPAISSSASVDAQGKLHITMTNTNPNKDIAVKVQIGGLKAGSVTGRYLQGSVMNAHNTFENPNVVAPKEFCGAKVAGEALEVVMPKMSVVVLEVL
jgi:alpha-N-arabinofuranosidase